SEYGKVRGSAFGGQQARGSARGGEPAQVFASSTDMIATKELKLAVKAKKSQAEVWQEVARTQDALARGNVASTASAVQAEASPTSLQLTLESRTVSNAVKGYLT